MDRAIINYVMTQILKLSCASFSYVNISYVLAVICLDGEVAPFSISTTTQTMHAIDELLPH